ncbi:hypothetical protein HPB48_013508 [Haemaphysalis longicornis]|uniref:Ionotropic receptor n=1 Tax=Haemaphysalis longicornis TaxID=44386 RepID=A0A9J6GTX0_HAELO|nr:hypothetical protein HPB48_013508 [Haemaphysalis longicornis]
MAQALDILQASFSIVGVPGISWAESIRLYEVHVIAMPIAITEDRFQLLHFTHNGILRGLYYVQKKTRARIDYLQFLPLWASILSLSMAACVGVLILAEAGTGTISCRNSVQDKTMALTASVLLFSSPLTTERTAARFVLAAWYLACFSLAVYLQSLLIASVTSGLGWEADNTLERLYPKVISGHLIPCCLPGFIFDVIFNKAGRNDQQFSIVDAIAAASQRFEKHSGPLKTRDSLAGCMNKVAKGTHVYVGFGGMDCWHNKEHWYQQHNTVEGQETLLTIPTGFAMRKDYYLRRHIDLIGRRLVETGWNDRQENLEHWRCFGKENLRKELNLPVVRQLFGVISVGCSLSLVVFGVELLLGFTAAHWYHHRLCP